MCAPNTIPMAYELGVRPTEHLQCNRPDFRTVPDRGPRGGARVSSRYGTRILTPRLSVSPMSPKSPSGGAGFLRPEDGARQPTELEIACSRFATARTSKRIVRRLAVLEPPQVRIPVSSEAPAQSSRSRSCRIRSSATSATPEDERGGTRSAHQSTPTGRLSRSHVRCATAPIVPWGGPQSAELPILIGVTPTAAKLRQRSAVDNSAQDGGVDLVDVRESQRDPVLPPVHVRCRDTDDLRLQ